MKVIIISDTHGKNDNFLRVMQENSAPDLVVHCGDLEGSEETIRRYAGCPVEMVAGNNDFFSALPREREFTIGRYKVWLTHGHSYYVSMGNELICREAAAKGADIVLYGHTHRPVVEEGKDVVAINPGSLSYPRQEGRRPSYAVMELDASGRARFSLRFLGTGTRP